mgnify:CR=1 FL=1
MWRCKKCNGTWIFRLGIVEQYINEDHENVLIFNEPSDKEYYCIGCGEYVEIYKVEVEQCQK